MFASLASKPPGALLVCLAIGASACSDATSSAARRSLSMSLTTQSQGAVADITITAGTNSLVITRAQLVARRIELAPVSASGCASMEDSGDDDDGVQDGCAEVEVGPAILDIPLNGTTKTSLTASVPAGSYRALEIRIRPVSSGNRNSELFVATHPEFKGVSVRVEGTFNGRAFVFTAPVDTRIESVFDTPVTVDATNPNVTVAIDLGNWFSDGSGGTLDPSNSSNARRISANIAGSFHAFEDEDHDGHEDNHR